MSSSEMLEFRINELDKIVALCTRNYSNICNNLIAIEFCLGSIKDRIETLESDLNDRKLKSYVFKLMMFFYPIVIGIMIATSNFDHKNLVSTMENIQNILGYQL